ncbi:uncharacterized protein TNIN_332761 [Trichonephila inaurata madagascariensis]|uniref:Uncharacterized protein n=1 Tax=Trichonephila inaurata madagascariensis TaxID=2747483 RepID=A0A8X6X1P2_9ARAC|nr:uncharacterized protein TNIN_332761 [Trichonephila inaurata madagascariensis]
MPKIGTSKITLAECEKPKVPENPESSPLYYSPTSQYFNPNFPQCSSTSSPFRLTPPPRYHPYLNQAESDNNFQKLDSQPADPRTFQAKPESVIKNIYEGDYNRTSKETKDKEASERIIYRCGNRKFTFINTDHR